MAAEDSSIATLLDNGVATPIAQLSPDLPNQASQIVRGEVTVTWPYNSLSRSLAFLLAESDIRLRRAKGQVRIQLRGSSAQAVASCGLGGGDEVALSLEGVDWAKDESVVRPPGSRVEWELRFAEKCALQVKVGDAKETKFLNIDHPVLADVPNHTEQTQTAPEPEPELKPATVLTTVETPARVPAARPMLNGTDADEYASPAFIQRAKVSYGALFETGFDIFEDDGGVKGKGRKRTRFGRDSSAWRYSSQSPSVESEEERDEMPEADVVMGDNAASSSPVAKPHMMDEGCQTVELNVTPKPSEPLAALPTTTQPDLESTSPSLLQALPATTQPNIESTLLSSLPALPTTAQPDLELTLPSSLLAQEEPVEVSAPQYATIPTQEPPPFEGLTKSSEPFGSGLFGTYIPATEVQTPLFPTANTAGFGAPEVSLGDQVRFGFTESQTAFDFASQQIPVAPQPKTDARIDYPEAYLDHAGPAFAPTPVEDDLPTAHSSQHEGYGLGPTQDSEPSPGIIQGQAMVWPITSGVLHADHADGHLPLESALPLPVDLSPPADDNLQPHVADKTGVPREVDDYGYNDRRYQNEAEERMVGMEDGPSREGSLDQYDEDKEAEYEEDEDAEYGDEETNEAGDDYDMRNYADVDDDEESFEQYDTKGAAIYEPAAIFDEDGDSDSEAHYNEDEDGDTDEEDYGEEEYESDYGEDEEQQMPPQPPAPKGPPVVIDLISDSEDDQEEIVRAPPQPAPSNPFKQPPVTAEQHNIETGIASTAANDNQQPLKSNPFASQTQVVDFAMGDASPEQHVDSSDAKRKAESPSYEVDPDESEDEDEVSEDEILDDDMEGDLQNGDGDEYSSAEDSEEDDQDESILDTILPVSQVVNHGVVLGDKMVGDADLSQVLSQSFASDGQQDKMQLDSPSGLVQSQHSTAAVESIHPPREDNQNKENDEQIEAAPSDEIVSHRESNSLPTKETRNTANRARSTSVGQESREPDTTTDEHLGRSTADSIQSVDRIDPSSPPLTQTIQSFESQVFTQKQSTLKSSPPTSQFDKDANLEQLPTPFDTQSNDLILTQQALSDELEEEQIQVLPATDEQSSPVPPPSVDVKDFEDVDEIDQAEADVNIQPTPVEKVNNLLDGQQEQETLDNSTGGLEVDSKATAIAHLPSPAPHQVEDVVDVKGEEVGEELSSQVSGQVSENGDDTSEDVITVRGTRGRKKKDAISKAPAKTETKQVAVDSSIELARSSRRARRTPALGTTTRAHTRSVSFQKSLSPDAADTSFVLAQSALQSPIRLGKNKSGTTEASTLKTQLSKRFKAEIHECLPLQNLKLHMGKHVDVVCVAASDSSKPERTKTRQFALSFNVTDQNIGPDKVIEVQVYRAHKDSLPIVKAGNGLLLRGFEIIAIADKDFGLQSHEESSYAVFAQSDEPQIKGPPMEDIDTEASYLSLLREWYAVLDTAAHTKLRKANQVMAEATPTKKT